MKSYPENHHRRITINSPQTPQFYTQPKVHKDENPGRPVIRSLMCHTDKISKYIEFVTNCQANLIKC